MRKTDQDLLKNRRSLDTLDLAHDIYQFIDIATTGKERTEARHKEHHTITAVTSTISTLIQVFSIFVYVQTGRD